LFLLLTQLAREMGIIVRDTLHHFIGVLLLFCKSFKSKSNQDLCISTYIDYYKIHYWCI
jgi:hypothetical protein